MGAQPRADEEDAMRYRTALTLDELRGIEDSPFGHRGRGGRGQGRREGRRHDRQEDRREVDRVRQPARRTPAERQDARTSRFPWAAEVEVGPGSVPAADHIDAELVPVESLTAPVPAPMPA